MHHWLILILFSAVSLAAPKDRLVEGYAALVSLDGEAREIRQFSYRGSDKTYLERSTNGEQSFTWKTAPVPADAKARPERSRRSGTVTFLFGVSLTGPKKSEPSQHELLLDGQRLVQFILPVEGDVTWKEGDVSLRFDFLSADIYDDLEGVLYLTLPANRLTPGQPAQLTAHGLASNTRCFFCLSAIDRVVDDPAAHPADNPTRFVPPKPITAQELQYNGEGHFQLFNRPNQQQGLDTLLGRGHVKPEGSVGSVGSDGSVRPNTLLGRGRVKPEELLVIPPSLPPGSGGDGGGVRTSGERTIFRDEYTHAEVWRLTNDPQGVNRHDYSAFPAWNANGRWIKISRQGMPTFIDQETGVLYQPLPVVAGQWSTTEPDILFTGSEWNGARAIVAYDFAQRKVVRGIGPVREYAGISPISADGKWVCWREGIQDDATTFGLGAADGSSYKSILLNGGIVTEQTPVTFALPGPQPSVQETRGGVHQMYFTRSPDHRIIVGSNSYDPRLFIDRIYTPDGRLVMTITETLSHVSWHPEGQFAIFCGEGGLGQFDPDTGRRWPILTVKENIEAHTTWTSYDPHWAGASFRTPFAGEVLRVSMDPDHSVARLCGSCPLNPDTTAYDNDEFACLSPDGTKVLFMSTMSGSVNEYLVVAANPRPPKLSGEWTPDGYRLTWTPDALSREIKGYRIYRTNRSGQDYRDIAGPVEGTGYVVTGLKKGEGAFFAVRAQEWSGLISRYSNEVSADGQPTAAYLEAETCPFTGFKQGFDPEGASDLYYLFVPKDGVKCSVTLTLPGKAGDVWIRVAGQGAAFTTTATGKPHPKSEIRNPKSEIRRDPGWTWVNLGRQAGAVTITSESGGFKIDRVFITPTRQTPTGRGLDYQPRADFQAPAEVRVQANGPFAATVTWKPITGARYYNVHASDRPDFTPAQSNLLYSPPAGTERAVDWGLKPGATYYYRVVAVDYDGTESPASEPAKCQTEVLDVKTVEIEYEAGTVGSGAQVEDDPTASGGRSVLLNKDQTYELRFRVPAEGDYVIWHQYRGDSGAAVTGQVVLDGKPFPWQETYDQAALYGQALGPVWVWHRYRFRWGEQANGILPLTAGEHILSLSIDHPIHLDQLVLTNDLSYVPEGRLCTF